MFHLPRYNHRFPVVIFVLAFIIILMISLLGLHFSQLTTPTEIADNVFISMQIDAGKTTLQIDNQSEHYFRTEFPDYADLEVYDNGKWQPITTVNISLLGSLIVLPNTTFSEAPYWSEAAASLDRGFYRVKFSGMRMQSSLSKESTIETIPDTFVPFTIP